MKSAQRIIARAEAAKEFVIAEDGFVYYLPTPDSGMIGGHVLRTIADELDRRNLEWQRIIDRDPAIGKGTHDDE